MHLIWQPLNEFTPDDIQHSLMSFTAHQFKNDLEVTHPQRRKPPKNLNGFCKMIVFCTPLVETQAAAMQAAYLRRQERLLFTLI
jgi:hypothetical protein